MVLVLLLVLGPARFALAYKILTFTIAIRSAHQMLSRASADELFPLSRQASQREEERRQEGEEKRGGEGRGEVLVENCAEASPAHEALDLLAAC